MRVKTNAEIPLILAPMAGATDTPFREICLRYGATRTVSEMVSSRALCHGDKKTATLMVRGKSEENFSLQLFGHEPEIMARAAQIAFEQTACDTIDINMGCPVNKIFCSGDGSALMRSPALIGELVSAVRAAVPCRVSVKLRVGIDREHANAVECALAAQAAGAHEIAIHARFRNQLYAPPIYPNFIAEVKSAVSVPVIGNGDITDGESAEKMLEDTGCDGLMIGRGALGNPFIFEEIAAYLKGIPYKKPSLEEKIGVAREHLCKMIEQKGEHVGSREGRSTLSWYLKGIRGASALRARAVLIESMADVDEILALALEGGRS